MFRPSIRNLVTNIGKKILKMNKKNRQFSGLRTSVICTFSAMFLMLLASNVLAGDPILAQIKPDDIHDVRVQVDYIGSVVVYSKGGQTEQDKETVLPLEVRANLAYEQQCIETFKRAIRHYEKGTAQIRIDKQNQTSVLGESKRDLNVFLAGRNKITKSLLFACPNKLLEQSEVELVRTPFDFLTLSGFLAHDDAKVGTSWQPADQDLVNVLAIDLIYTNDVELTVKEMNDDQTKIYVTGRATGEVDGEDIEVTISAVGLIDNQKDFVKSFRASMREVRDAGQIAPGFEGTVKFDLRATKKTDAESIPVALRDNPVRFRPQKLAWQPENSFEVYFDPRWRLITSEDQAAVFRLLDNGDLLAQCNVVQLPNRPENNLLELAEFRSEVGKMMDGADAEILNSKESQSSRGLSVLKVEVLGEEKNVPIRWTYYHVGHNDGRRLTFIFSVEDEVYDRFNLFGNSLVDAVLFKPVKEITASAKSKTNRK